MSPHPSQKTGVPVASHVVVAWLQNDWGQLGRPGEAVARALASEGLASSVAYVEPQMIRRRPLRHTSERIGGLSVHRLSGWPKLPPAQFGRRILRRAGLDRPILLNFGVSERNLFFSEAFSSASRHVLVTYDRLDLWPDMPEEWKRRHERIRSQLIGGSDLVIGLSEGSINDIPDARYVGHGCDDVWLDAAVDEMPEPSDLAKIQHPRAVYVGSLSVRVSVEALEAVAATGTNVVLIGFDPSDEIEDLVRERKNVHYLGTRQPHEVATYLLHCDVGLIPHTNEAFTHSMEPHKVYNYTCAGLRSVVLHAALPPRLTSSVVAVQSVDDFAAAVVLATSKGRLTQDQVEAARSITWESVARSILEIAVGR